MFTVFGGKGRCSGVIDLPLVDGHLDLAENVTLFGRDLTLSAAQIRAIEKRTTQQATVSLPDLERGGIAVVCATVTAGFPAADVGEDFEPRSAILPPSRGSRGAGAEPDRPL
jgi:hypothetical protein